MAQVQIGWICRTFIEQGGEVSQKFNKGFFTEEAATEFGYNHCAGLNETEWSRWFEVYKDFTDPF